MGELLNFDVASSRTRWPLLVAALVDPRIVAQLELGLNTLGRRFESYQAHLLMYFLGNWISSIS